MENVYSAPSARGITSLGPKRCHQIVIRKTKNHDPADRHQCSNSCDVYALVINHMTNRNLVGHSFVQDEQVGRLRYTRHQRRFR
jgi:hypothetical protein